MIKNSVSILLGLLLVPCALFADPVVSFDERRIKARVGDTVEMRLIVKDFDRLDAGGVTVKFNPSKLQVQSVTLNASVWRFVNRSGDIDNETGEISDIGFSHFQGVSGPEAEIGTITFATIRRGRSKLKLSESTLSPFAVDGEAVSVKYKRSIVSLKKAKKKNKQPEQK